MTRPQPPQQRRPAPQAVPPPGPASALRPQTPSAPKLIAAVAIVVAVDILLFFAIGYLIGRSRCSGTRVTRPPLHYPSRVLAVLGLDSGFLSVPSPCLAWA